MKKLFYLFLFISALVGTTAFGLARPRGLATDGRIKVVAYRPNQVYAVHGSTFITTQIVFGQNEQIVDVEGGDAAAWTINIDKILPNVLNIKPTVQGSNTNLTVVTIDNTGKRRFYRFSLASNRSANVPSYAQTYAIQFMYPEAQKAALLAKLHYQQLQKHAILSAFKNPSAYNWNYSFSGSRSIMPLHVFDDGAFTYFQLRPHQLIPAVFAVNNPAGKESVVNYRRVGNYLVVEQIAPQFTLRAGKYAVASLFNNRLIARLKR